jgi:anti-sigma regulatory factor (Ser/Thr protein kinase)
MQVEEALAGDGERKPFALSFSMGPGAPAHARARVSGWLTGMVAATVLRDARLLVSELVTNTLHGALAAGAPLSIAGRLEDAVLWIEVVNPGHAGTVAMRDAVPEQLGGYGLQLVEALAQRWGVDRSAGATTRVWFELPLV